MYFYRINTQLESDKVLKSNPILKVTMLLITLRVIELQCPKMILLPNSGAVKDLKYILEKVGGDISFSEVYGTHILKVGQTNCPIFLSANLYIQSSQLDTFSKDRYKWHVKQVWEKLNNDDSNKIFCKIKGCPMIINH